MSDQVNTVREYYNGDAEGEWGRLGRHISEFEITKRFMDRYIRPGDSVLDVGGGPGRYSMYLAEKGCDVTLFDLSEGCVAFAERKAGELSLKIRAAQGDAREVDKLVEGMFDHVLLMGPMYHLLEESDRERTVAACLRKLKPGGVLFVSFISISGGIIWMMRENLALLGSNPLEEYFAGLFADDQPYSGMAFTEAHFTPVRLILPFMERFGLTKLHLLGQEGITAICENALREQPPEVVKRWLDLGERVCERDDLLMFSEHILYIGKNQNA